MNYNDKKFRPIINTENGEIYEQTIFHYKQDENVLTCEYSGEKIIVGQLLGLVDKNGNIDMRYQQINTKGQITTDIYKSKPEILQNGKIRLYEDWQWTSGNNSNGHSIIEEI